VQLLLPLRHLLYPGNVSWTEEGHRWAWRMMIRQKTGSLVLVVTDPDTGAVVRDEPQRYVTRWQEKIVVGNPDMILQLAHHVADLYRREDAPAGALDRAAARVAARLTLPPRQERQRGYLTGTGARALVCRA
jgi:hypothetical protein